VDPAAEAQRLLELLRDGGDPGALGDVSMLPSGFDAASRDEIARQFGEDFAEALVGLEPGGWVGPIRSPFGIHLVRVTERQPARQPALAEIRERVLAEWREQRRREAREQVYLRLRERYEVVMEAGAQTGLQPDRGSPTESAAVRGDSVAAQGTLMPEAAGQKP
jgi:parvulin-like peptidyl-prolyl isomerase